MLFVSITRLRVRSWVYLLPFVIDAVRIARQAAQSDGNLTVRLLRDRRLTFWTGTSWSSESAMRAFMRAAPHQQVMRKLPEWCDEASVVHWTQDGSDLPSWEEAHRRMQQEGRPSRVNHPTPAQTAFTIPAPAIGRTRDRRFK